MMVKINDAAKLSLLAALVCYNANALEVYHFSAPKPEGTKYIKVPDGIDTKVGVYGIRDVGKTQERDVVSSAGTASAQSLFSIDIPVCFENKELKSTGVKLCLHIKESETRTEQGPAEFQYLGAYKVPVTSSSPLSHTHSLDFLFTVRNQLASNMSDKEAIRKFENYIADAVPQWNKANWGRRAGAWSSGGKAWGSWGSWSSWGAEVPKLIGTIYNNNSLILVYEPASPYVTSAWFPAELHVLILRLSDQEILKIAEDASFKNK